MVKGIFTAFLLFNVLHITPNNTKRALRVTSYLVECAVATEPRSGWRGGLWSGLNRTKLERGALLVIRGLGGTKNTQGGWDRAYSLHTTRCVTWARINLLSWKVYIWFQSPQNTSYLQTEHKEANQDVKIYVLISMSNSKETGPNIL